jgi:hypothetical protein
MGAAPRFPILCVEARRRLGAQDAESGARQARRAA